MRPEDLAIGDLYYRGIMHSNIDGDYTVEFFPKKLTIEDLIFAKENDWDENDWNEFTKPIQLTREILKKNGFKEHVYASLHTFYYDEKRIISLFENIGFSININGHIIKIQYVHELQYVLKLCGLNELADNFKI